MAHPLSKVLFQATWTAVKERTIEEDGSSAFDVWKWSLEKRRWVRLAATACGYGSLADARCMAEDIDIAIKNMLEAARTPPPPLA